MSASRPVRGRLAPSPTGFLHLGNAWAFLLAWLACRSKGGSLVLRMEDIDPDRSRPEYADAIIRDLRWLGLDWDEGPDAGGPAGPYVQSARMGLYADALNRLDRAGHIYPCYCTRKELRTLAGAPHVGDAGAAYPGTCRNLPPERRAELEAAGRRPCIRLRCPSQNYAFEDAVFGPFSMTLEACGGDFALRRSDGVIAYQLAVVVDDGLMGITQVVRAACASFPNGSLLKPISRLRSPSSVDTKTPLLSRRKVSLVASCADGCYFLGCCLVALVCAFRRLPTQGRFPSWPYTTFLPLNV